MNGVQAFRSSVRTATRSPGLIFTLYVTNLLLAIPLAIGLRVMLGEAFGSSMAAGPLLEGFDLTAVRDLLARSADALRALVWTAVPTAILGMFVNTICAGGILTVLVRQEAFSLKAFIAGVGTYLGRMFRLWLLMAIIALVAFVLLSILFGVISSSAIDSNSGRTAVIGTVLALLVYAPMIIIVMAADYAKVALVASDLPSAWRAAGQGFLFVATNAGATIVLQVLLFLLLCLAALLYWGAEELLIMSAPEAILLLFLLQQIFIGARMWIRTGTFAGSLALFGERKPRPVVFYGWDDSPERESA
jgi:hypothetical protein